MALLASIRIERKVCITNKQLHYKNYNKTNVKKNMVIQCAYTSAESTGRSDCGFASLTELRLCPMKVAIAEFFDFLFVFLLVPFGRVEH